MSEEYLDLSEGKGRLVKIQESSPEQARESKTTISEQESEQEQIEDLDLEHDNNSQSPTEQIKQEIEEKFDIGKIIVSPKEPIQEKPQIKKWSDYKQPDITNRIPQIRPETPLQEEITEKTINSTPKQKPIQKIWKYTKKGLTVLGGVLIAVGIGFAYFITKYDVQVTLTPLG